MAERKHLQLHGHRPSALKISKHSHNIKKPPPLPPPPLQHRPVIIYTDSPKIIHTNPTQFKDLVQRLTGCQLDTPDIHQVQSKTISMSMSMPTSSTEQGVESVGRFPTGILPPTSELLPPIMPTLPSTSMDLSSLTHYFQDSSIAPNNFASSLDFFDNFPDFH
ncbi:VQ motif-containing protein 8, chloroplastic, partial [Cucurbita argyrosperma subsp. argyrosperma]